ncbi:hypothetical protein P376_1233 [Streptomyces sp. HCCB10043]|nr:hypothetical protein P376_1233 [Streptomyces sp. HCCB10043]
MGEDLRRDLDQIRIEPSGVPRTEDVGDLCGGVPGDGAQQVVRLGDQLHVRVLDAVVDHLHEVARAVRADVRGARRAVLRLRGDPLQHRAQRRVGLRRAARHDAGPVQRALLAAGDPHSDEVDPALAQLFLAAAGVLEVGVAAVDDDVALLQQWRELLDHRVGGFPRLHHDHQAPGAFQGGDELLGRVCGDEGALVAELLDQGVGPGRGAVVQGDGEAVAGEVPGEVAAHDRESGDADLSSAAHLCAPGDASAWGAVGAALFGGCAAAAGVRTRGRPCSGAGVHGGPLRGSGAARSGRGRGGRAAGGGIGPGSARDRRGLQERVVVPRLGDHVHRGLLGRRRRSVDAHVAGGEGGRDRPVRLLGQPPGAGDTHLVVPGLAVAVHEIAHTVAERAVRLGNLPRQPGFEGLAGVPLVGRGAESLDHPRAVRGRVALVQRIAGAGGVHERVLRPELLGGVGSLGFLGLVDVVPPVAVAHGASFPPGVSGSTEYRTYRIPLSPVRNSTPVPLRPQREDRIRVPRTTGVKRSVRRSRPVPRRTETHGTPGRSNRRTARHRVALHGVRTAVARGRSPAAGTMAAAHGTAAGSRGRADRPLERAHRAGRAVRRGLRPLERAHRPAPFPVRRPSPQLGHRRRRGHRRRAGRRDHRIPGARRRR